jgi:hypothetical protein
MLKLIYTETDLQMEKLATSIEEWISQRVLLALRVGNRISVEPTGASFGREASETVSLSVCDDELIEIGLEGYWLCQNPHSAEGIFVTHLPAILENTLLEMWEVFNCRQTLLAQEI